MYPQCIKMLIFVPTDKFSMVHDSWLKIRIGQGLVDGLRAKYGNGVSKAVRGLIERDLGVVEKKSDAVASKGKMTWRERLELQKSSAGDKNTRA